MHIWLYVNRLRAFFLALRPAKTVGFAPPQKTQLGALILSRIILYLDMKILSLPMVILTQRTSRRTCLMT